MTVLLVILTFAVFIVLDYVVQRRKAAQPMAGRAFRTEPVPSLEPVWVAGYQLPENLYYHPGHTWARALDADTVVVGMDDFARRLLGPAKGLKLPAIGDWLRQGDKGFTVQVDGRAAELRLARRGRGRGGQPGPPRTRPRSPRTIPTAAAGS